ncbi:MAG: aminoglycoside phosphotransferase family protein [bacterium]
MNFFTSDKLKKIITQSGLADKKIIRLEFDQPQAFSAQSRLIKIKVFIKGRLRPLIIRGNHWPVSAYHIARDLNKEGKTSSPAPIYYHKPSKFVLYPELDGAPLRHLPLTYSKLSPFIGPLAKQLALFHKTRPPAGLLKPVLKTELKRWQGNAKIIIKNSPKYSDQAKYIVKQLAFGLSKYWVNKNFTLTHGDYQASNVLVRGRSRVSLIDFTMSRIYFPASDLGIFLVHWQAMTRTHLSITQRERLGHKFLQTYLTNAPKTHKKTIIDQLPLAIAEATLDVAAISLQIYGGKDKNVNRLLTELFASLNI